MVGALQLGASAHRLQLAAHSQWAARPRPKSARRVGKRPKSGKALPRLTGAVESSPAQSSYVQPSDVRIDAVEDLRDQVAFSREFDKVTLQQQQRRGL